jgi:hypothetical protein
MACVRASLNCVSTLNRIGSQVSSNARLPDRLGAARPSARRGREVARPSVRNVVGLRRADLAGGADSCVVRQAGLGNDRRAGASPALPAHSAQSRFSPRQGSASIATATCRRPPRRLRRRRHAVTKRPGRRFRWAVPWRSLLASPSLRVRRGGGCSSGDAPYATAAPARSNPHHDSEPPGVTISGVNRTGCGWSSGNSARVTSLAIHATAWPARAKTPKSNDVGSPLGPLPQVPSRSEVSRDLRGWRASPSNSAESTLNHPTEWQRDGNGSAVVETASVRRRAGCYFEESHCTRRRLIRRRHRDATSTSPARPRFLKTVR